MFTTTQSSSMGVSHLDPAVAAAPDFLLKLHPAPSRMRGPVVGVTWPLPAVSHHSAHLVPSHCLQLDHAPQGDTLKGEI